MDKSRDPKPQVGTNVQNKYNHIITLCLCSSCKYAHAHTYTHHIHWAREKRQRLGSTKKK